MIPQKNPFPGFCSNYSFPDLNFCESNDWLEIFVLQYGEVCGWT